MLADILSLADALALEFQNRITLAGVLDTTVTREYEVTKDLGTFVGRNVEIYPLIYKGERVTRSEKAYDFRYSFVVMERYRGKGTVPKTWIDGLVNFVEEYIFNPLDQKILTRVAGVDYESTEVEVTSVFDFDFLRQYKVFWSELETVMQKIVPSL